MSQGCAAKLVGGEGTPSPGGQLFQDLVLFSFGYTELVHLISHTWKASAGSTAARPGSQNADCACGGAPDAHRAVR
jgi:hypothetical protein